MKGIQKIATKILQQNQIIEKNKDELYLLLRNRGIYL